MAELTGHVAIVTGAGRGLGLAVAERLAAMPSTRGSFVSVNSRRATASASAERPAVL